MSIFVPNPSSRKGFDDTPSGKPLKWHHYYKNGKLGEAGRPCQR
jgi:hypothetical protein